jgi:hypothetical protein
MDSMKIIERSRDSNKKVADKKENVLFNLMSRKMSPNAKTELNVDLANLSIDLNMPVNQLVSPHMQNFFEKWFLDFKI